MGVVVLVVVLLVLLDVILLLIQSSAVGVVEMLEIGQHRCESEHLTLVGVTAIFSSSILFTRSR